jgi:hypothetical protein
LKLVSAISKFDSQHFLKKGNLKIVFEGALGTNDVPSFEEMANTKSNFVI